MTSGACASQGQPSLAGDIYFTGGANMHGSHSSQKVVQTKQPLNSAAPQQHTTYQIPLQSVSLLCSV